jgi:hypothetical protein
MRTSFRCTLKSVAIAIAVSVSASTCLASAPSGHAQTVHCFGDVTINHDGSVDIQSGMVRVANDQEFEIRADRIVVRQNGAIVVFGKGSFTLVGR